MTLVRTHGWRKRLEQYLLTTQQDLASFDSGRDCVTGFAVGVINAITEVTRDTAGYWARLCAQAEAAGKPMAAFDSLIAATALEHGLAVVTRNVSDFASAPVVLVNPWDTVPGAQ